MEMVCDRVSGAGLVGVYRNVSDSNDCTASLFGDRH